MLVILHGTPGSAPGKTILYEEFVEEIVGGNLIAEVLLAIDIRQACGGLYDTMTVFLTITDIRVIKGVDVDS